VSYLALFTGNAAFRPAHVTRLNLIPCFVRYSMLQARLLDSVILEDAMRYDEVKFCKIRRTPSNTNTQTWRMISHITAHTKVDVTKHFLAPSPFLPTSPPPSSPSTPDVNLRGNLCAQHGTPQLPDSTKEGQEQGQRRALRGLEVVIRARAVHLRLLQFVLGLEIGDVGRVGED